MQSNDADRHLRRLALVLALSLLSFAGLFAWQTWRWEKADQINQLQNVLEIGEKAVDLYFVQTEASLKALAAEIERDLGASPDPAQVLPVLRRYKALHSELSGINLVRLDGQLIASSESDSLNHLPSVADEPSFIAFGQALNEQTSLHIGRPLYGKVLRQWIIPIRLVMRDQRGQATMLLAANVPVELLQAFWRDTPLVTKAGLGLISDEGYLISRFPLPTGVSAAETFGRARDGVLRRYLQAQGLPQRGYVEGQVNLGAIQAGNAFLRLSHYPMTLFVTLPTAEFHLAWWRRMEVPLLLLALLGGVLALGYRHTGRRQREWDAERRAAEGLLRDSEREQRFLIDHLLAGVVVHDPAGKIVSCNLRGSQLLGLSPEQVLGRAVIDPGWHFVHEDGSRMPVAEYPVARALDSGQAVTDFVLGVVQASGAGTTWLICNAYPELDAGQRPRRVVVTFVDITARRLVEHELERSEGRYRMLFENSIDGLVQTRPDGSVLAANPAACRMFQLSEAELIARGRDGVVDPGDPRLQGLLEARQRDGQASGELSMRRGDGTLFEAEISSTLYVDNAGQALASLFVRDVTERRRGEAAMRAKELAEQANRAKSEFIARMSHELRTPLNAILGFSEALQLDPRSPLSRAQSEQLGYVRSAGDHLLVLINDLLDLSRIEAGELRMQFEDLDLWAVALAAERELASQAEARQVSLILEAPPGQRPLIRSDPTRMRQIVLNLLSNAIKYNRPGGIVRLRLMAGAATVRLEIEDHGLGMSPEQVGALFQPFNRLGREASSIEGTGIGLVVTRGLVELMGGQISVRSELGAGSVFAIEFPALAAALPADATDLPRPAPPASGPRAEAQLIYIDDDEVNRILMEAFLAMRPGLVLRTAAEGRAGLALAAALRPDLMLIDMMMPGMGGMEVIQAVRADPALRGVPCVAVSANAMPDEIDAALAAGFDGYLTKPLNTTALFAEIDRLFKQPR